MGTLPAYDRSKKAVCLGITVKPPAAYTPASVATMTALMV
jgi:hypothetical protein